MASNINYKKSSQHKVRFVCNICHYSSIDKHSFAVHMSDHPQCNMHECIVCDMKFSTVVHWTNHIIDHENQVDLNLLETQIVSNGNESNISGINSRSVESQTHLKKLENGILSHKKCEFKSPQKDIRSSKRIKQNRKKPKSICNMCQSIF